MSKLVKQTNQNRQRDKERTIETLKTTMWEEQVKNNNIEIKEHKTTTVRQTHAMIAHF